MFEDTLQPFHIISMKRGKTSGSSSPMWSCDTQEGIRINIFQHIRLDRDSYRHFTQYHPEMNGMELDAVLRWEQHPILVYCRQEGQYYNPVSVAQRPAEAVTDGVPETHVTLYRRAAIRWARTLQPTTMLFDTETTGIKGAEICELAIIDLDGVIHFHDLIMPLHPERLLMPGRDGRSPADVNQITPDRLREANALPFTSHYPAIYRTLLLQPVIAYNVKFDLDLLNQEALRAVEEPFLLGAIYDAMLYAQWMYADLHPSSGGFKALSLQEAARRAGIDRQQTHGALDDCYLLVELIQAIANTSMTATLLQEEEPRERKAL